MAVQTKAVLKTFFEQGDIPTQGQYADLIDSQFGLGEAGVTQIIQGTISASSAEIEDMTFKKLQLPGNGIASMKVGTTFRVGKTLEVSGSMRVHDDTNEAMFEVTGNITASGQISASSAHINSFRGNITSSGNISASGTITANKIETDNLVSHVGDPDTEIAFTSDTVKINANSVQQGRFGSNNLLLGNSSTPTGITGSRITFSTAPSSSNGIFVGGGKPINFTSYVSASAGINLTQAPSTIDDAPWESGGTLDVAGRRVFQITFSNFPAFSEQYTQGISYHDQFMTLANTEINVNSVVICQQGTILNAAGQYIKVEVWNVQANTATLRLKQALSRGSFEILEGGSAVWNFVVL